MKIKMVAILLLFLLWIESMPISLVSAGESFVNEIGTIEIEYGFKGYIRVNSIFRVEFTFKDVKKDFDGRIEIQYYSDDATQCTTIQEISLKRGVSKKESFYSYLNSSKPEFKMAIFDQNGNRIWSKSSEIDFFDTDYRSDIVIGEWDGAGETHSFKGESNFNVKRLEIASKDFSSDYRSLSSVDILVIPDGYWESGNPNFIKMLFDREKMGGIVVEQGKMDTVDLNRVYLAREDRSDWMWRVEKVVNSMLKNVPIHSIRYMIILGVYSVLAAPVLYFILYKKKKRHLYWVLLPAVSFVFTVFIYIAGSDSRIAGLKINYVSVLDLRRGRSYENSIFAITNSTNRSYDINVSNHYTVEPAYGLYGTEDSKNREENLKRKVYESKNRTEIQIGNGTAFETVYFKAEGTPFIKVEDAGSLYRENGVIHGEFINKLGISLDKVFALCDDEIIYLGSVENGEKREVDTSKNPVYLNDLTAHINDSNYINIVFENFEEEEEVSKEILMTGLMSKLTVRRYLEPIFIALTKERLEGEFSNKINAEDGYSIMLLSAKRKKSLNDSPFVNSINKLPYQVEGETMNFLNNALLNRSSIVVSYDIRQQEFNTLSYFRRYNRLISPYTISLKNIITGEFDPIFMPDENYVEEIKRAVKTSGEEVEDVKDVKEEDDMKFVGLKRYLKNGKLTVKYEITPKEYEMIISYTIPSIPKLSLE